jgi:YesN/AraC family two-component response regulator
MKVQAQIVVVEDERPIAEGLMLVLSDLGHLRWFSCGAEVLRSLEEDAPSLLILDVMLPDISGIEILCRVREQQPQLPVILMTAYGSEDLVIQALRIGIQDYFRKPFPLGQLRQRVLDLLGCSNGARETMPRGMALPAGVFPGIHRAIRHLEETYWDDVNLRQLASTACMSEHHFCRTFKKTVGVTFRSYLNTVRIERAKTLLQDRGRSVTDVAFSVGYKDLRHFERVFKLLEGTTPTHYRQVAGNPPVGQPPLPV